MSAPRFFVGLGILALCALPALSAEVPDRSGPPEVGPPPSLTLPVPETFRLENGLRVVVLEKHDLPLVQLELLVASGGSSDPADHPGLASMVADMLDEGAGGRDALSLSEAIEHLGAELRISSSEDATGLSLFAPAKRLPAALEILADVVMRPTFPEKELERLRRERLTDLLQARDEPRAIASVELDVALFGEQHPYGRWAGEAALRALRVEDLRRFHAEHYRAGNATVIVVGDVAVPALRELLARELGEWSGGTPEPAAVGPAKGEAAGRILFLDKPGAAQSEIRVARVATDRKTEGYYPMTVMNTVLGGSFTSRLNSNLREDKGYTYGAGSIFDLRVHPGPFLIATAVQTEVTALALGEIFAELEAIATIPEDELDRARSYVALRYPSRFQTVEGIAGELSELVLYDLPLDTMNHHVERLLAVTREQAQAAARRWADPAEMLVLVVGDRAAVGAEVEALGLGEVEYLTIDQVLGPAPEVGG